MVLKGEIGSFEIEILANRVSGTKDFWEENWLYATIKGVFPGFTANYGCNLRTDDFLRCLNELKSLLLMETDKAQFTTLEEGVALSFTRDYAGKICVDGKMISMEYKLEFRFFTDDPTVGRFIGEMQEIIDKYPIIGSP